VALFIGTSGWVYPDWTGRFYPNNKIDKLSFYSKVFRTVEVNMTFYRFPTKSLISSWDGKTPSNFKFSFKVPRIITHYKRLTRAEPYFERFLESLELLRKKKKLGCVLIQFPPNYYFESEKDKFAKFCRALPDKMQFAVEFRDPSWINEETRSILKRHNLAYAIGDSKIKKLATPMITSDTHAFIRWHGRKAWYNYNYSKKELETWAKELSRIMDKVPMVYGYFNNDVRAYAPFNAFDLLEMLDEGADIRQKLEIATKRAAAAA
jgi:uncharacterized protein YecE (DUF72 family)